MWSRAPIAPSTAPANAGSGVLQVEGVPVPRHHNAPIHRPPRSPAPTGAAAPVPGAVPGPGHHTGHGPRRSRTDGGPHASRAVATAGGGGFPRDRLRPAARERPGRHRCRECRARRSHRHRSVPTRLLRLADRAPARHHALPARGHRGVHRRQRPPELHGRLHLVDLRQRAMERRLRQACRHLHADRRGVGGPGAVGGHAAHGRRPGSTPRCRTSTTSTRARRRCTVV